MEKLSLSGQIEPQPLRHARWMSRVAKLLFAGSFFAISATMEIVALGRQDAWNEPLNKWGCELADRPPVPGVLESFVAAGTFDWIVATVIPGLLCMFFLVTSKSRMSLLIWSIPLALHLGIRYVTLDSSFRPWGACGLHNDGVFGALLLDLLLFVLTLIGCVMPLMLALQSFLRRNNVQDRHPIPLFPKS